MTSFRQPAGQSARPFWTLFRVILGATLLGVIFVKTEHWSISRELVSKPWVILLLGLNPFLAGGLEALRLQSLAKAQGITISFRTSYWLVAVSSFFNLFVPGGAGGDVAKLFYMAPGGRTRRTKVAAVLLFDRAAGLYSLCLLTVILAGFSWATLSAHPVVGWLVLAALLVVVLTPVFGLGIHALWRQAGDSLPPAFQRLPFYEHLTRFTEAVFAFRHRVKVLCVAVLLSMGGHLLLCGLFGIIGAVVMPTLATRLVCLLALLGFLANALPVTPGGLGVGEAAFEALFRIVGTAGGAQLMLGWRVGMLPVSVLGGFLYMRGRDRRNEQNQEATDVKRVVDLAKQ